MVIKFNIGDIVYDYKGNAGLIIGIDAECPEFVFYKCKTDSGVFNVAENNLTRE